MIDLHIHSKFSDGKYSVEDILQISQNIGCMTISIVDHNTCDAYEYIKNMNERIFEGKIISGCEFNTFYNHIPIELLGYDFEPEILKNGLKKIYKYSANELQELEKKIIIEKCNAKKIIIGLDKNQKGEGEHISTYLHKCLRYYPENIRYFETEDDFNNPLIFYRKYMSNPNSIFYCDMEKFFPTLEEVECLIRKSGGKVFIPHIFEYKNNAREILTGLIKSIHIDEIECFYSKFTIEQRDKISKFAEDNNFLKSGGSDCHNGKNIKIGIGRGDLYISQDMIGNWINLTKNFNIEREKIIS